MPKDTIQNLKTDVLVRAANLSPTVRQLIKNSVPDATRKAFVSDLRQFLIWLGSHTENGTGFPVSPETVAEYIGFCVDSGKKRSTINRHVASLSKAHDLNKWPNPCKDQLVKAALTGLARSDIVPRNKARALLLPQLLAVLQAAKATSWIDRRNGAIVALGWLGALRCSELVALNVGDLEISEPNGLILYIKRSKTDQEGRGKIIGLPHSEITDHVLKWLQSIIGLYHGEPGPLFPKLGKVEEWVPTYGVKKRLSQRMTYKAIKTAFKYGGLDTSCYSPHSLRSGLITTAAEYGVPEHIIQQHSRHASIAVLRGYVQAGRIWTDNPLPAILGRLPRRCKQS